MENEFKNQYSLEHRKREAEKMLEKYPDKVPVICIIDKKLTKSPDVKSYYKYIIPKNITISSMSYILRNKIKISHSEAITVFSEKNTFFTGTMDIMTVYHHHANQDKFLYLTIKAENAFGVC